jgi:Flp pilus assembly protein TadG
MKARRSSRQRGSVSVEFGLIAPLLLMLILGGVHFGRVLTTRHHLTEATNYAARAAAVARTSNSAQIRNLILSRMGTGNNGCSNITVTSTTSADAIGVQRLDVTARCAVASGVGGSLLGAIGPSELRVTASMPF